MAGKKKRTKGEGTIYQRKDGYWAGQITVGCDSEGKIKRRSFVAKTQEEVIERMQKEQNNLRKGIIIDPNNATVSDWFKMWLETYKRPTVRPSTFEGYEYATNNYILEYLGGFKLDKVRTENVQMMFNEIVSKHDCSESLIKKIHITVKQGFEQAIKNNVIHVNPVNAITIPKTKKPKNIRILTQQEQTLFEKACLESKSQFSRLFLFLLNTGLRIGEACALTWNNVSEESINITQTIGRVKNYEDETSKTIMSVRQPKTDKGYRKIPLSAMAKDILNKLFEERNSEYVFGSKTGTPYQSRNIRRALAEISKVAKVEGITPHSLRHTFGTRLIESGVDIKTVAELLGHSDVNFALNVYIHSTEDSKKNAIEKLNK